VRAESAAASATRRSVSRDPGAAAGRAFPAAHAASGDVPARRDFDRADRDAAHGRPTTTPCRGDAPSPAPRHSTRPPAQMPPTAASLSPPRPSFPRPARRGCPPNGAVAGIIPGRGVNEKGCGGPVSRILSRGEPHGRPFLSTNRCRPVQAANPDPWAEATLRPKPRGVPIRHCFRWGLPCRSGCPSRGGPLPHRFTLTSGTRTSRAPKAVSFLWRFPSGCPARALPGTVAS